MSNTNFSNLAPVNFKPMIQEFLSARLVATQIADTRHRDLLTFGQKIDWPYITDPRRQTYTPGTDLTIDGQEAFSDQMTIDQSDASTFGVTPKEEVQAKDKGYVAKLADRQAYVLANSVDHNLLKLGVDNAFSTQAGGAVTVSNVISNMTSCISKVEDEDAAEGRGFFVIDPARRAILTQAFIANGHDEGDVSLRNGFVGKAMGSDIYVSTNLPATVTLTIDTQPADGETITIKGVVFTWRDTADGAGEVDRGGNLATAQANLVLAVNGTGVGDGTDYFELDKRNRRKLQNKQVAISAFAANVATLTSAGKMNPSETMATVTNIFGTESISLLYGMKNAIGLGMQIMPTLYIGKEPKRPEENYITHQLYGKKVFYQDTFRLCKWTMNA